MKNKTKIILITTIVLILVLAGGFFMMNNKKKTTPDNEYVTVMHRGATIGSLITVDLTESGKTKYSDSKQYKIFTDDNNELSVEIAEIGTETTIFPKADPGDDVVVFLYDEKGDLIDKLKSRVIKK